MDKKAKEKDAETCPKCVKFFARFRCDAPGECDCPVCQGTCTCSDEKSNDEAVWDGMPKRQKEAIIAKHLAAVVRRLNPREPKP